MRIIFYNTANYSIEKYLPKIIHDNILDKDIPKKGVKKLIIINEIEI